MCHFQEEILQECADGTELTMLDIVIRREIQNENENNVKNDCVISQDMDAKENFDVRISKHFILNI